MGGGGLIGCPPSRWNVMLACHCNDACQCPNATSTFRSELPLLVSQNDRGPHTDTFSGGDPVLSFTVCVYLAGAGEMLVSPRDGGDGGGRGQRRVAIVPGRLVAFDNSQVTHSVVGDGGTRVMVGPMSLRPGTQRFEPVGGDDCGDDISCGVAVFYLCCMHPCLRCKDICCSGCSKDTSYGNFDIVWNHFSALCSVLCDLCVITADH